MSSPPPKPFVPNGSDHLAHWARLHGAAYVLNPPEDWFRQWEPHDTLVAPELFYNSITLRLPSIWGHRPIGDLVIVEPWTAPAGVDPLERTIVGFATHPGLMARASMRTGEPFLTRVAFLESAPPNQVKMGEKVWDENVTTFARTEDEAKAAFTPALRELLRSKGFRGQLEMRPGGLVVHFDGLLPRPDHVDMLYRVVVDIVTAALNRR
ncbi:MAG: hypothetical protein U0414_17825 [Polyangiaceae bacterium]